jgi:hypothetical protein
VRPRGRPHAGDQQVAGDAEAALKGVNAKEATEIVHMDRHAAPYYTTT